MLSATPTPPFRKDILLWDDILAVFSNTPYLRSGTVAFPFLKGPDFKMHFFPSLLLFTLHFSF
jgi:hypothetical protein